MLNKKINVADMHQRFNVLNSLNTNNQQKQKYFLFNFGFVVEILNWFMRRFSQAKLVADYADNIIYKIFVFIFFTSNFILSFIIDFILYINHNTFIVQFKGYNINIYLMLEKTFEQLIQFKNDGGASCKASLPRIKNSPKIQVSFCYLYFCVCCQGCISTYKQTQTITITGFIEVSPDEYDGKLFFQSKPLLQEEIWRQGIRIKNVDSGQVQIQLFDEQNKTLTQVLARSQKNFVFCATSRFLVKDQNFYIVDAENQNLEEVKMIGV